MPEPLKNLYSFEFLERVGSEISSIAKFDCDLFLQNTIHSNTWENLELKPRMKHIAKSINAQLSNNYSFREQSEILIKYSRFLLGDDSFNMNFLYMFIPDYIETFGIDDYENSITAFVEITKFTSCEFAIRPFIIKYPQTINKMLEWTKHPNPMVRRLASEGSRPRLPWGMALPIYKRNPSPIIPILEQLICDENEIVRRSVANNLNDICKDNPKISIELGQKWIKQNPNSEEVAKLVKHGLRTLLKSGNQDALEIFGIKHENSFTISDFKLDKSEISIGEKLYFDFNLINTNNTSQNKVRAEYVIYFLKSNGTHSPKVFQIGEYEMKPNERKQIKRSHLFKDFTTRKHYLGKHKISIKLNGVEMDSLDFELN